MDSSAREAAAPHERNGRAVPAQMVAVAGVTAALALVRLVAPENPGKAAFLVATGLAAALACVGASRRPAAEQTAWCFVAVGMVLSATADSTAR